MPVAIFPLYRRTKPAYWVTSPAYRQAGVKDGKGRTGDR